MLKGVGVSPGIAIGKALIFKVEGAVLGHRTIADDEVARELQRLEKAIKKSKQQLVSLKNKISKEAGKDYARIFDAHILMLEDEVLINAIRNLVKEQRVNVEWALKEVRDRLISLFAQFDDEYMQDRGIDVEDVWQRIQSNLSLNPTLNAANLSEEGILIAPNISPSELAQMDKKLLRGFVTDAGGRTSHTGILARSLKIPAVIGLSDVTSRVKEGDLLLIDGNEGVVIVNPNLTLIQEYESKKRRYQEHEVELLKTKELPAVTLDGRRIALMANIELPEEINSALQHAAEGIGLFRSEFLYLRPSFSLPSEEEIFLLYRELAEKLTPYPATIRTLDLGGDKMNNLPGVSHEANPFLGLRAIRFCFKRKEVFKTQLRALLRASAYGNLRIIFPMISGIEEIHQAKLILEEVKEELHSEHIHFNPRIPIGVLIEIPSAALIADLLAKEVDFFSIGTNDLIQYLIAVDRSNVNVSYLYEPLHPAIIRSLKFIVDSAKKHEVPVSLCGEMAGDPAALIILLGLGLDELSMNPYSIPLIKRLIRSLSVEETRRMVRGIMRLTTARQVEEYLLERLSRMFPEGYL